MEIGDGPAAVTGDERRSVSLIERSGRRGVRTIRESEDLPETMRHSPRIRETATRRGFTRASPDHFLGPGFFLPRPRPVQGGRHRDGSALPRPNSHRRTHPIACRGVSARPADADPCQVRLLVRPHRLPAVGRGCPAPWPAAIPTPDPPELPDAFFVSRCPWPTGPCPLFSAGLRRSALGPDEPSPAPHQPWRRPPQRATLHAPANANQPGGTPCADAPLP